MEEPPGEVEQGAEGVRARAAFASAPSLQRRRGSQPMCMLRQKLHGERDASVECDDLFASVILEACFERCPQQP